MITFNEIIDNKEYRERVIKFFRLPIRLSASKEKFLSDLEFIKFKDVDKYLQIVNFTENDFNKAIEEQGTNEPDFTMENILDPIVNRIAQMKQWQDFINEDYSNTLDNYEGITNPHQFYKEDNNGKHFVSFDLKSANWQSLQTITGIEDSYQELIAKHTNNLIPPISKTMRTKVTALLNAKRIMDYNKYLLNVNKDLIIKELKELTGVDLTNESPFAFYADEFLIEVDKKTLSELQSIELLKIENEIADNIGIQVHITPFTLKWLSMGRACAKVYKDGYEFLNISKDIALIIDKLIHNVPVKEIDFEGVKLKGETKEELLNRLNVIADEYR